MKERKQTIIDNWCNGIPDNFDLKIEFEKTKRCRLCGERKPISEFYDHHSNKDGKTNRCRECCGVYTRKNHLNRNYGITDDQYRQMLEDQDHRCWICGKHKDEFERSLDVDHDHETGEVRGLLCSNCNRGVGCFKDDPEILKKAIEYLENYKK